MKTAMSRPEETDRLQDLGRASMQIVHDLKNQLNGLKLYATFLRRRIEKSDRPGDEQETIVKLIRRTRSCGRGSGDDCAIRAAGGVEETIAELKSIRFCGQRVRVWTKQIVWKTDSDAVQGSFDHFKLTDAFKWLCSGAVKHRQADDGAEITVTTKLDGNNSGQAVIEWAGLRQLDHDPFRSFAGSDEIKLALAAKIIEAHGGSAKFIDKKFVVELPLSE